MASRTLALLMVSLFSGILNPDVAQAQNVSFEDSKTLYKAQKTQYETDILSIRQTADTAIASIDQDIQKLEIDFQNCTSFDCRKQTRAQIGKLEATKKDTKTNADVAIMEKAKVFVKKAQVIAVESYVFEVLQMAASGASGAKLEHFVDKRTTSCGFARFSSSSIGPSQAMTCRQMNVEFKLGNKFYKLSTAVGLQFGAADHYGTARGFDANLEVNTIDKVFSLSTPEFLQNLNAAQVFLGGPGAGQTWSQVIFDYYGQARFYAMYNPFWVGRYTVSIESL